MSQEKEYTHFAVPMNIWLKIDAILGDLPTRVGMPIVLAINEKAMKVNISEEAIDDLKSKQDEETKLQRSKRLKKIKDEQEKKDNPSEVLCSRVDTAMI